MTALTDILLRRIAHDGPISIADYMAECLMHPQHGYYQSATVFGADGDFITAPEVSQMFGEMLGLWCADRWVTMGEPESFYLIELGPGRGTLMADMLRATSSVPGFHDAAAVVFIEASAQLKSLQAEKVPTARWYGRLTDVPEGPTILVANEFFDALPIHQFEKRDDKWAERAVTASGKKLMPSLVPASAKLSLVPDHVRASKNGSVAEVCPAGLSIAGDIAMRFSLHPGAALIIDYGYAHSAPGDSFQALRAHEYVDPFAEPGLADLTAHVAFDQLAQAASEKGATASTITEQGAFLMAIGLGVRAQALAAREDDAGQARILSELKRLTAPDEMGSLFKALAIQPPGLSSPPGF
ncbi:class I SAM-dependent methyltransferase [Kordiimonas aestuarii]|uniref:class I SAM-dependent methyltransferase n=1 Tax=Kordiimonas aestuarii TaxID=1005925 RepID=UPI0021D24165|nr:SAM-dependent methyltransferase [Kordiimonas aestuarii]